MNKIICRLSPVTQSSITVVDEQGNQISNLVCGASDFSQMLYHLADKHNAKENIYFYGPQSYTAGLVKVMEKENLKDYNYNDYKITIM